MKTTVPLGEFQEDMRLREGVSLIRRYRDRAVEFIHSEAKCGEQTETNSSCIGRRVRRLFARAR